MKKIALILALLTVFSLFTACNDDITEEPTATVTNTKEMTTTPQIVTDGSAELESDKEDLKVGYLKVNHDILIYDVLTKSEIDIFKNIFYIDENAEKTVSLRLGDIQFSGEYYETRVGDTEFFVRNCYKTQNGDFFEIDEDGVIRGFIRNKENFKDRNKEFSKEEAISVVSNFLSNIVDVSLYDVEISYDEKDKEYYISYKRILKNIDPTDNDVNFYITDYANFYVTIYGDITAMFSFNLGKLSKNVRLEYDIFNVWYNVEKRLNSIYAEKISNCDDFTYENIKYGLSVDENGKQVIICVADVTYKKYVGGEYCLNTSERQIFYVFK